MSSGTIQLVWAAILIVAIPVSVVVAGEVAERLRQRSSPLASPVSLVRDWVLPLVVAYVVVRALVQMGADATVSRFIATAAIIAAAIALSLVTRVLVAAVKRRASEERRAAPPQLLLVLPRLALVLVTLWLLLSTVWGVEVSSALTALGVTSLIISLALQQPLGSLASGLLLLGDQPFRPGEWIRVDSIEGRVVDVNWRTTRVENRDGDLVVLPNAMLASATIVNFDQPERLHRVVVPVQVAFSNPPARAIEMLLTAARNTPGVLSDPPPDVKVVEIDDPLMGYEVQVWIDDHTLTPRVRSDLGALVWYWSERMRVPLPSPAQDLYLWDGRDNVAAKETPSDELGRRVTAAPLLAGLSPEDARALSTVARRELFAPGETILDLDRGLDDLVVIHQGQVSMSVAGDDGTSMTVGDLGPGDVFGLMRRDHLGGADVRFVAIDECDLVVLDGTTAAAVIGRSPQLADALQQLATQRQRRIERLVRVARERADGGSRTP